VARTLLDISEKVSAKPASKGIGPRSIRNEILLALPSKECAAVRAELEFLEMPAYNLLNEMGETIEFCYFMNSGMTSILTIMGDGKGVEVGLTGKEGFIGLPLIVGLKTSATRAIVQITGSAFRISAAKLLEALAKCPQLGKKLNRYAQELGMQATQVAACNRVHNVVQRLARWLLMSQDRVGGGYCASDAGVPFPHAGNAARQRDGCRRDSSESGSDQIRPRLRDHRQPKQAGSGIL
jgi:CRP-like cAMP-binding protein